MALLDKANTDAYGHPEMTEVEIGVRQNPGILVSGHDLRDLEMLLEQTQGYRRRRLYPFRNASRSLLSVASRSIPILRATTETPGGSSAKSLKNSTVRF